VRGDEIVDVAHEALIRSWKLLRGWLDEDRDVKAKQDKLEKRAEDWQQSGQSKAYLLPKQLLKDAKALIQSQKKNGNLTLKNFVLDFVKASEQKQKKDRLKLGSIIFVPIIGTLVIVHKIQVAQNFKILSSKNCNLGAKEQINVKSDIRGASDYLWKTGYGRQLTGIQICRENLPMIDLSDSNLSDSKLQKTNLNGANLQRTKLTNSDLRGANIVDAKLMYTYMKDAQMDNIQLQISNLTRANFVGATLKNAGLQGADLTRADFTGSDLTNTDFSNANLTGTDFSNANLTDTIFIESQGLSIEQLKKAKTVCGAKFPPAILVNMQEFSKVNQNCKVNTNNKNR
jgi:uncharacterized protein YjbI with pentapeptide repeats